MYTQYKDKKYTVDPSMAVASLSCKEIHDCIVALHLTQSPNANKGLHCRNIYMLTAMLDAKIEQGEKLGYTDLYLLHSICTSYGDA